jgi:ribonuclease P protein component
VGEYSFDKSLRLLDSKYYQAIFDNVRYKVSSRQVLFLAIPNQQTKPRLGLIIAKKNIKLANQRNRIKRIMRESYRLNQHNIAGLDIIVLARRDLDQQDNKSLHQTFNALWLQLQRQTLKKNSA